MIVAVIIIIIIDIIPARQNGQMQREETMTVAGMH
jgi:hypothetical protein